MNSITFSIIIPTFNRAWFLLTTLKTVFNQNYRHFEVIVVDDGSTDYTAEVIKNMDSSYVKYFYKNNEERAAARNYGIQKAIGEYITFLDSDDVLYPEHLETAYQLIKSEQNPPIFHIGYEIKTGDGSIIHRIENRKGSLNEQLIFGNSLSCLGVFIRRDIALQNFFNEDRALSGSEDYELWMRLASRYPIVYSNKITASLIQHDMRSVQNFNQQQLIRRIDLLIKYLLNDPEFVKVYRNNLNIFLAHRYLYLSLHLMMGRYRMNGLTYWLMALRKHPKVLFSYKTLGILKNAVNSYLL